MAWIFLLAAGLFEIVWAYFLKASDGFTKLWPSLATLFGMVISFGLLAKAMQTLPLGTAYMIWTGIGALGAFGVGVWILGEPLTGLRVLAAGLLLAGLLLMKFSSP